MIKAGLPQNCMDGWIKRTLEFTDHNMFLNIKSSIQRSVMRCCPCKHCLTAVTATVPDEQHDSTTLTLAFISLLWFYFDSSSLQSHCISLIIFFFHLTYTPFYCGVTDGGWSTWPNLVFYLARVFSYFAVFYFAFIHSLFKQRPCTILGEFPAFIL